MSVANPFSPEMYIVDLSRVNVLEYQINNERVAIFLEEYHSKYNF